jgi:hypothetical protein
MKNIILSLFCVIATMTAAFAQQQVQATLTHPICNADGEITVTIPNNTTYPPPYTVEYYYYETIANSSQIITHSNVTNTDILTGYIGGPISIRILNI